MSTQALSDLLVVSLEQAVAAPYCTRLLAEGGARIIKLERPEGDFARAYDTAIHGQSAYFVWLNSGKESLAVDLTKAADAALLRSMLARADVFVQNLKPGSVDRLGFGFDAVQALNPRLVMCSISGYGASGPYADMKAYDALIQAETGLCSVTGAPGQPSKVGASICDISTGLSAYGEVLKALYARHKTGLGTHIELSLFEVLSEWMAVPLAILEYTGKMLSGTGMDHAQLAPYGAYAAADGPIFVVIQNHREWLQLCRDGLDRPDMADDPRYKNNVLRVEHRDALRADMEAVFARYTQAELAQKLNQAGIACGSINDIRGLQKHPALRRKEVITDGQTVSLIRRTGDVLDSAAVPAIDEHGNAIRAEFAAR